MTRGMGIGGMEGVIAREDHNYRHGIREGERRMLRLVFTGAACAMEIDRNLVAVNEERMRAYHHTDMEYAGWEYLRDKRVGRALANGATALAALHALRDLGDEDASRVLGERGW